MPRFGIQTLKQAEDLCESGLDMCIWLGCLIALQYIMNVIMMPKNVV